MIPKRKTKRPRIFRTLHRGPQQFNSAMLLRIVNSSSPTHTHTHLTSTFPTPSPSPSRTTCANQPPHALDVPHLTPLQPLADIHPLSPPLPLTAHSAPPSSPSHNPCAQDPKTHPQMPLRPNHNRPRRLPCIPKRHRIPVLEKSRHSLVRAKPRARIEYEYEYEYEPDVEGKEGECHAG